MKPSIRAELPYCLATAMLFLVIGPAVAMLNSAMGSAMAQSTAPAPFVFGGHTRVRGGDSSFMIGLVEVDLYCSTDADALGDKFATVRSDYVGVYELAVPGTCEFYNLVGIPPQGHSAHMAETVGGKVINDSWIQYTQPLQGKELGRNEFWMIADSMVVVTPTPFPARRSSPAPTPTPTFSAPPSATAGAQATANPGPLLLEYIVGVLAASGVMLAVRHTIRARRRKD